MSDPRSLPAGSPPLSDVLLASARNVADVLAGRSLSDSLAETPPALRAAAQAVSFHAMRRLGGAMAVRAALVKRTPADSWCDALLLVALALLDTAAEAEAARDGATLAEGRSRGLSVYAVHTVVDQAVRAASQRRDLQAYKPLINAVLRNYLRQRDSLRAKLVSQPQARWNHPAWWVRRLREAYPHDWRALLSAADVPGPMTLRVNLRRTTVPALLSVFEAHGIAAGALGVQGVLLETPRPVHAIPGFEEGWWSVQDLAAQQAALLLAPTDGMRVLDACAAPGGKTAHLLELADVSLVALDADAQRLARVSGNLARLGLDGPQVRLACADAAETEAWWDGQPFDAVLADVPCTASGIVRRHPDIRWLRREEDLERTAGLQRRIVDALWPTVRPGGRLLYATCSIFPHEGERQAQAFADRWPDAVRLDAPGQLLPLPSDGRPSPHDGFFYALFAKADPGSQARTHAPARVQRASQSEDSREQ